MKVKVVIVDLELSPRVKKWGLGLGIPAVLILAGGAVAWAAGLHTWNSGDVLTAADLNANFNQLQSEIGSSWVLDGGNLINANPSGMVGIGTGSPSAALDVNGAVIRRIARVAGNGPNENPGTIGTTTLGPIASRKLQYTKTQAATGLRITWQDNLRCSASMPGSCEWEIKIDGASCAIPGALTYDMYNGTASGDGNNIHRPQANTGTCFALASGPLAAGLHTIQVTVTSPVPMPAGDTFGVGVASSPWTGWNQGYWSLEVEEVY